MGILFCCHEPKELTIEINEEIIQDFPGESKRMEFLKKHKPIEDNEEIENSSNNNIEKEQKKENNNSEEDSEKLIEEDNDNQEQEYKEELKKSEEREIIEQQLKQENFIDSNIKKSIVEQKTYIQSFNHLQNSSKNINKCTTGINSNIYESNTNSVIPLELKNANENIIPNINNEDLNNIFQSNIFIHNKNINVSNINLQASNIGQEEIINNNLKKYFLNNYNYNTYEIENKYSEYNMENNQGYEQNLNNENNQYGEFFQSQLNKNSINMKQNNVPKTYFYSYDYNYDTPTFNNN